MRALESADEIQGRGYEGRREALRARSAGAIVGVYRKRGCTSCVCVRAAAIVGAKTSVHNDGTTNKREHAR